MHANELDIPTDNNKWPIHIHNMCKMYKPHGIRIRR